MAAFKTQPIVFDFLKGYTFNPNTAFVDLPKINLNTQETYKTIAENFPYNVVGTDFSTGSRNVNILDPDAAQDLYGGQSAIPSLLDQIAQVDPYIDAQRRKNLLYQQQVSGLEAAQNLAFAQQMYPLISRAAEEGRKGNLETTLEYEGRSPKYGNIFAAQAKQGEAALADAYAKQLTAARAALPRYSGRTYSTG